MQPGPQHHASICIERTHPALAGHFPGRPVVPGVVVLDHVVRAAQARLGRPLVIAGLTQVKFSAPLGPGEVADCLFELRGMRLAFRVERGGRAIAQGSVVLADPDASTEEPA